MSTTLLPERTVPTPEAFGLVWPEFNDGLTYTDVVKEADKCSTLIQFYSSKYRNSAPLQGWNQRIHNGQITIDNQVVTDPDATLRAGSKLLYHRQPWREPDAPYILDILFEDEDVLAVNKPSGLQVLPGGLFQERTVLTQLLWRAEKHTILLGSYGNLKGHSNHPVPVHRLGRGTSGVLLCAKTKLAKARLAAYFADGTSSVKANQNTVVDNASFRRISKVYRAVVQGIITVDEVVIKQPIGTIQYPGVATGLYVASSLGKPAWSKVSVLERDVQRGQTLVQVEIHSGRPHQIRIHLAFLGHPLVGDPLYIIGGHPECLELGCTDTSFAKDGGYPRPLKPVPGDCGYHLHAHRLVFCHPTKEEVIEVEAPLPPTLHTSEETKRSCGR
ncbi:RNA pseudouridine synthase 5 isoform X2 [Aristolochia californica]|uniref:RNA pseudouridine synthase 5 isoform X2 n=1 Tax=Aristolochia californica TaxID=171875 RepID=UPI0035D9DD39